MIYRKREVLSFSFSVFYAEKTIPYASGIVIKVVTEYNKVILEY